MRKIDRDINERFIKAATDIIERRKNNVTNITGFCKSIKMHTTAYPQIKNNTIHVAMNKAYELGVKHGVSMNWLFFEIGPMYMESDDWKQDIRKTIKKLESLL